MYKSLYYLLTLIVLSTFSLIEAATTTVTHYGQTVTLSATLRHHQVDENSECLLLATLDKPIKTLPLPVVSNNQVIVDGGIACVILFISPETPVPLIYFEGQHVVLTGSLWYADWWKENYPFMLIVEKIEFSSEEPVNSL